MVVAAVGVATAAYGAYSANQNSKKAGAAMGAQQDAANANLAMEQQYRQQQEQRYGPLMDQYAQQASGGGPLDYGLMSGQIQGNFDQAQRNLATQMAARGLSGSGLAAGATGGMEIGRANALSGAYQTGLDRRRQLGLSVLQHYNPGQDVQGVSQAYGNQQQMYGQYAGMYGQAAQQGYSSAASALGSAASAYGANATPSGQTDDSPAGATADPSDPNSYLPYANRGADGSPAPMPQPMANSPLGSGGYDAYFGQNPSMGYPSLGPQMIGSPTTPYGGFTPIN